MLAMGFLPTLDVVRSRPWTLCEGNIRHNLLHLHAEAAPENDEAAWKFWCLLQFGDHFVEQLVRNGQVVIQDLFFH